MGDNDLHHLSQSRCCCGIDTIGENFDNYLKYNLTYMVTGDFDTKSMWLPKCNCKPCFFSRKGEQKFIGYKDSVDKYFIKHKELFDNKFGKKVQREFFGAVKKKLF